MKTVLKFLSIALPVAFGFFLGDLLCKFIWQELNLDHKRDCYIAVDDMREEGFFWQSSLDGEHDRFPITSEEFNTLSGVMIRMNDSKL